MFFLPHPQPLMKLCPACGKNPRYTPPKGRCVGYCSPCWAKRAREWGKKNLRHRRNYQLVRKFGITIEQYEAMSAAQGHVCAICREKCNSGYSLAVDHNHTTGKNRSLLCGNCNRGIGNLRESPAILQRAMDYLNAHSR